MKRKIIWIVLFILVVCIAIFVNYNKLSTLNNSDLNQGYKTGDSYEIKKIEINDPYMVFDVQYPYFNYAGDDFNLSIENILKQQIEEDRKISAENWRARYETQSEGENITQFPNEIEKFLFNSNFEIIQNNKDYISFVLNYGGFTGGAHGYMNKVSFNYDIKNKKEIFLKDLFYSNPNYLNYLSKESRKFLKEKYAVISEDEKKSFEKEEDIKEYINNIVSMIESGTEPKEENFKIFTFSDNKIKIYFSQYQVGPYAIGMPEVEIDIK